MPTNEEINKYLTEAMGECYHQWRHTWASGNIAKCKLCGFLHPDYFAPSRNPDYLPPNGLIDFDSWQGFGKLWEWAKKQEWWYGFYLSLCTEYNDQGQPCGYCLDVDRFIHPKEFAEAVYKYIKTEVKG